MFFSHLDQPFGTLTFLDFQVMGHISSLVR
jgi:hypothetical protein